MTQIPEKDRDFATIIPGRLDTYIYEEEEPYYLDLDQCDPHTMSFLPKELIMEAMELEGVSYLHIDHSKFDRSKYDAILEKLLEHTRTYLTSRKMAEYVLKNMNYTGSGKILFLTGTDVPDYLFCSVLIGLKQIYGDSVVDVPKIDYIYTNYSGDIKKLYGRGMTYTKIVPDLPLSRSRILERIIAREFDLIIYACIHRGLPYYWAALSRYPKDKIAYFCGEDFHSCQYIGYPHLFLREFRDCPPHLRDCR
ncbi:MAG: hypothetical protein V4492_02875 [Chlamydiota bacterium]